MLAPYHSVTWAIGSVLIDLSDTVKRAVILPWFAFLFGAISTALSFASPRSTSNAANDKAAYSTNLNDGEKKEQV